MKRYGNLFNSICDIENIKLAHKNARKKKTHYKEVKQVDSDVDYYCNQIRQMLIDKTFVNSPYEIFTKKDKGKTREIYKLPYFPDRIIHHAIVQVVERIWKNTLITDTYQSIKGRGLHKAIKKIKYRLHTSDEPLYYLKLDIKKYYPSINNNKLKETIRNKIKCKDTLWLLDIIIDSTVGVPIGNYLSQYFGNLYVSKIDHEMKETYRLKDYYRYCDDIVAIHRNKSVLHKVKSTVRYRLQDLDLELKTSYCVRPIDEGLDFLGVVMYNKHTLIRKKIKLNYALRLREEYNLRVIASYNGWLLMCNSYNLRNKYEIKRGIECL